MKKLILIPLICLKLVAQSITNGDIEIATMDAKFVGNLSIDGKKKSWISHPSDKNLKFAIVAASYHKNSDIILKNDKNGQVTSIVFKLVKGEYKREKISVAKSKVTPPKEVLERIEQERNEANKIYLTSQKGLKFNSAFILPMDSAITSHFGTARVFNELVKSYHTGTDFRATIGTPVVAANDGEVVIAKDRYYAGGSVVIDHGEGIYTQYYHLNEIGVSLNQNVKKGDIIGLSGDSGRVSGPHLHFGVIVGGVQVEPLNFIKKINLLF